LYIIVLPVAAEEPSPWYTRYSEQSRVVRKANRIYLWTFSQLSRRTRNFRHAAALYRVGQKSRSGYFSI